MSTAIIRPLGPAGATAQASSMLAALPASLPTTRGRAHGYMAAMQAPPLSCSTLARRYMHSAAPWAHSIPSIVPSLAPASEPCPLTLSTSQAVPCAYYSPTSTPCRCTLASYLPMCSAGPCACSRHQNRHRCLGKRAPACCMAHFRHMNHVFVSPNTRSEQHFAVGCMNVLSACLHAAAGSIA